MENTILVMVCVPQCLRSHKGETILKPTGKEKLDTSIELIKMFQREEKKILGFCAKNSTSLATSAFLEEKTGISFHTIGKLAGGVLANHYVSEIVHVLCSEIQETKSEIAIVLTDSEFCYDIPRHCASGTEYEKNIINDLPSVVHKGDTLIIDLALGLVTKIF